jgi:ASC-1-like (ASCH) protein
MAIVEEGATTTMTTMEVCEPWLSLLRSGRKTVEGRKGTPRWSRLAVGDVLQVCGPEPGAPCFPVVLRAVRRYEGPNALEAYLRSELDAALPGVATVEEGAAVYLQWSTQEEIERHGMLALEVGVGLPE